MRSPVALVALMLVSCKGGEDDTAAVAPAVGPELSHTVPDLVPAEGDPLALEVLASDSDGVAEVVVYHRTQGTEYWDVTELGDGDTWTGSIEAVYAPGVEYYFKATDDSAQSAVSYLPEETVAAPFVVEVLPASHPLPFEEDFESESDESSLFQLDWWTPSDGYDAYAWELTQGSSLSGDQAALHPRGNDGVDELADWLISPAIDLSGVDGAMVSWWELGQTTSELEEHGLYISAGSRLPEDGDFVEVDAVLDAPTEDSWGRSAVVDLSAWAGEPVVYLGWYYRGSYADDWYLDDVLVRELAADLVTDMSWSPDPVYAGESTTISLAVDNLTDAEAPDVVATFDLPEGGGSFADDGVVGVGTIDALGSGSAEVELSIDSDTPDHSYLPIGLVLTSGEESWESEFSLTLGLPSEAEVDLSLDTAGLVRLEVGVGDPDDPAALLTVVAESLEAGEHTVSADLTPYWDSLPAAPGADRWWARVNTAVDGSLDAFVITFGGESEFATGVPLDLSSTDEDDSYVVYLPEPPEPELTSVLPSEAGPGDSALTTSFTLYNAGWDTDGAVSATLSSVDAHATVDSGASFSLTTGTWGEGDTVSGGGPVVSVSSDHVDSTPVEFELLLEDASESWVVDVAIDVPWPVLRVSSIEIDDRSGGDGDGVLDPDESATIEITVANAGQMSADGQVYGTAAVGSASTAIAFIDGSTQTFGLLSEGREKNADFEISVDGGSDGDTVEIELSFTDDSASYSATTTIVLGEPPWSLLSPTDDPVNDNLDGYEFDFLNGYSRVVDGTTAELWLVSDEPFDSTTLFIEAWGLSSGGGYDIYRWVIQSGVGTLQGYTSGLGFQTIASPDVDFLSDTELVMSWSLADMDLAVDSYSIGFAAGWCGPDEYFCDHFPDGWGYPYDGWNSTNFFDVDW